MEFLLQGNRVFKQELDEVRYLFLPKNRIQKYCCFYNSILIKKGDLLFPSRWINHKETVLMPLETFNIEDYECMFFPNLLVKDMQKALDPFINIRVDEEYNSILALEELPAAAEPSIRDVLKDENEEPMIVEAYMQPDGSYIILDYGMSDHDIDGECTEDFAKLQISESYDLGSDSQQHIYKTIPIDGEDRIPFYTTSLQWYHSQFDESTEITTLKELDDIEDMLPFTKFQLAKK
ncbi:hypothetical protein [Peribacillus frigoritolerans]|uniref:Uncharacterized protein n=1 Tax=Peribacillus castrilensis TaxID=2897690 RepID=A0AAW9NPP0_9BACI|nr:hypothetical protein [Peribacillus castrilensis]